MISKHKSLAFFFKCEFELLAEFAEKNARFSVVKYMRIRCRNTMNIWYQTKARVAIYTQVDKPRSFTTNSAAYMLFCKALSLVDLESSRNLRGSDFSVDLRSSMNLKELKVLAPRRHRRNLESSTLTKSRLRCVDAVNAVVLSEASNSKFVQVPGI